MATDADPPGAETIFLAALELPRGERPAYLAGACGDNQQSRQRVEALIMAHEAPKGFLPEQPGVPTAGSAIPATLLTSMTEQPGDLIGSYKLLQKLGEGGCGVVYMAEQEKPVRRKVALKVIKLGMDTRQVVARFEAERQALALMDHPNIARVLEAGATETGRPYFVMELVGGVKITDYCDQSHLDTRQRLDLFMQVCRAIQHAHQKGVIHRDIKPSNVLVATQDGVTVPKVIDFGIAKATQGRLTDQTVFTAFEQFLGTPAYMSPEQAQLGGLDVDTRSDIYSLGVLLYELLTGKTPFDSKELLAAGLEAMRRTIQEKEPPTPSTRLKQDLATQKAQSSDQSKIKIQKSKIENDLDWIVMKCLEKDRARRYETANGLARDINRHLNNEPVLARQPSKLYEFQKTVRRHKVGFAATAAIILALAGGAALSTWQAVRATRAEREQSRLREKAEQAEAEQTRLRQAAETARATEAEARQQAEEARAQAQANEQRAKIQATNSAQVAQFTKDILTSATPTIQAGWDSAMFKDFLDRTAEHIGNDLTNQPAVQAELWSTIGSLYDIAGEHSKMEAVHRQALEVRRRIFGSESAPVADSLHGVGRALTNFSEAVAYLEQATAMRRRILGSNHVSVAASLSDLGKRYAAKEMYVEAERCYQEVIPILQDQGESERATLARALARLAAQQVNLGMLKKAEATASQALVLARHETSPRSDVLGYIHRDDVVPYVFLQWGRVLAGQGRIAEAEEAFRKSLEDYRKSAGNDSPALCDPARGLADCLAMLGKLEDAEMHYLEISRICLQSVARGQREPDGAGGLADALMDLARRYQADGKEGRAADMRRASTTNLRYLADCGGADAQNNCAWVLATSPSADIRAGSSAIGYASRAVKATGRTNAEFLDTLAAAYAEAGQFTNAVSVQQEAIGLLTTKEKGLKQDLDNHLRLFQSNLPYRTDNELARSAFHLLTVGRFAAAEVDARACLTLREIQIPDDWRTFNTKSMLGEALLGQKDYAEAEPLLLSGYQGMKLRETTMSAASKVCLKDALERLRQLYEATGQPGQAAEWKQRLEEFERTRARMQPAAPTGSKP